MKRLLLNLLGILLLLIGLILLGTGAYGAIAGGQEGKLSNSAGTASGSGNALLFNDFSIDTGGVDGSKLVEMSAGAKSLNGKPLFIGLAQTNDVINYLNDVPRDVVTGISSSTATVTPIPGNQPPAPPADQTIWQVSDQGAQPSIILPGATTGSTVVVMNQDGSPNVAIDMLVGVDSPKLFYGSIGLAVLGALSSLLGILCFRKAGKIKRAKRAAKLEAQHAAAQQEQWAQQQAAQQAQQAQQAAAQQAQQAQQQAAEQMHAQADQLQAQAQQPPAQPPAAPAQPPAQPPAAPTQAAPPVDPNNPPQPPQVPPAPPAPGA